MSGVPPGAGCGARGPVPGVAMSSLAEDLQQLARTREFAFDDRDFEAIRALVKQLTGINLSTQKRELVYGRLARRLRALGLKTFRAYRERLAVDHGELAKFCNAITTNLTSFFRERHHFDYLRDKVLLPFAAGAARRLRIWSAGCSTGEEPYSIAMTVAEVLPDFARRDIRILATDIDSDVLARAEAGLYPLERVRTVGPERLARFFVEGRERCGPVYGVSRELRPLVTFRQLNLVHQLPMRGPLDVIFCRNTIIYFDKDTQRGLFGRIALLQRSGDLLCLGHSENLFRVSDQYAPIGRTMYQRV
ncbi:MAG TPA: protein-glutamate O-methyltransferase CheR [Steroidobacteraceae bacterium]|nr:protein-glutamate O-methyltransferase CheR [Steroidobacteraceae bacterium]